MIKWRRFDATNESGSCLWCGNTLRKANKYITARKGGQPRGDYGDDKFCGLRCGYSFAKSAARNGYRFNPRSKK